MRVFYVPIDNVDVAKQASGVGQKLAALELPLEQKKNISSIIADGTKILGLMPNTTLEELGGRALRADDHKVRLYKFDSYKE